MRACLHRPPLRLSAAVTVPLLLVAATTTAAQEGPILVGADRAVEARPSAIPLSEPYLAVSPDDPRHLVVAAMVVQAVRPYRIDCAVFASRDAGETWIRTDLQLPICANAWLAIVPGGAALLVTLASRGELLAYRSAEGGRTWGAPVHSFGRGYDYPKVVRDPFGGNVYVVSGRAVRRSGQLRYGIAVAVSEDRGASFPVTTLHLPSSLNMEAQTPVVLSDGTLLVPYTEHGTVGGQRLDRQLSWLLASRDGGRTFSEPRSIADGCMQRYGWASLAADTARGPYRDRIYWLCVHQDVPGVNIRHSDDAGRTWSDWVRVDRTAGGAGTGAQVALPVMAINRDGVVGVMWLRREETERGPCDLLYFSASRDGGASFLPAAQVSRVPSCPAADPRNAVAHGRRRWGGDYNGLASTRDGLFHAVWVDARGGTYQLRHASVRVLPG